MKRILTLFISIFMLVAFLVSAETTINLNEQFELEEGDVAVLNDLVNEEEVISTIRLISINYPTIEISYDLNFSSQNMQGEHLESTMSEGETLDIDYESETYYELSLNSIEYSNPPGNFTGNLSGTYSAIFTLVKIIEDNPSEPEEPEEELNETEEEEEDDSDTYDSKIIEKRDKLLQVIFDLDEYLEETKQRITISNLPEGEKEEVINELENSQQTIREKKEQLLIVESENEIGFLKVDVKNEINRIKPIVENSNLKIFKQNTRSIIDKLTVLSTKLEKIQESLGAKDTTELNNLIQSANEKLERAEQLSESSTKESEEVQELLKDANDDIKEAFEIVRSILEELENELDDEDTEVIHVEGDNLNGNLYVTLNEIFKLQPYHSAKLIMDSDKTFVVSLKEDIEDSAYLEIYYYNGDSVYRDGYFNEGNEISIGEYKIDLLEIYSDKSGVKLRIR